MSAVTHTFGGLMLQSWQFLTLFSAILRGLDCCDAAPESNLGGLGKEAEFHFAPAVNKCYLPPRIKAPKLTYLGCP
jgi:hypothetical protein